MTLEETIKKIEVLERRLQREKAARLSAESILEEKSKQVYEINQNLIKVVSELEKLTVAVEQSPIAVLISDVVGIVEYANHSFSQITGLSKTAIVGKDIRTLGLGIGLEPLSGIKKVMADQTVWKGEVEGVSKNKQIYKLAISISPILDNEKSITHFLFNGEDVTKQRENEEKIYKLAHHDSLTGLYNRFSINGILEQSIQSAARNKSMFPDDGSEAGELIKNADAAMYFVKNSGRRKYSFFTKELNKLIDEKNEIERELRLAIDQNKLMLFYQPQIYLGKEATFGVEALLRWNHEKLGFISPETFVTVAEERGLIYILGQWVIDTAFKQLRQWTLHNHLQIKVAINISTRQIENPSFLEDLIKSVEKHAIDPANIELEITESIAMRDPEKAINTLKELRALGFEIAIDDFGTGHSSLAYLKKLPIQTLKLDKSFVENLEDNSDSAKICKASISLSHELGLFFVAEGIESKGQAQFFAQNNCDILQGYYFCRPVPADSALEFILQYKHNNYF